MSSSHDNDCGPSLETDAATPLVAYSGEGPSPLANRQRAWRAIVSLTQHQYMPLSAATAVVASLEHATGDAAQLYSVALMVRETPICDTWHARQWLASHGYLARVGARKSASSCAQCERPIGARSYVIGRPPDLCCSNACWRAWVRR